MRTVELSEAMFEGAISVQRTAGGLQPWRLPCDRLGLFPPEDGLVARAAMPSGVRLRMRTEATAVGLAIEPADVARRFDLTVGAELLQSVEARPGAEAVDFIDLPAGEKVLELWLPADEPVVLRGLRLSDGAQAEPAEDDRPRWVTYGSSISHCRSAHSPARTWPATAARLAGLHLTNLGYGGQCHMDPMIGRMIRDLPADVITLKVGINIQGASSLSGRTFTPALIGLVSLIRERHPQTPIGVISPIISPPREHQPNAVGLSLQAIRQHVRDGVERLVAHGDRHLRYFDGRELFGEALVADYLPDQLHPNGDGYEIMGRNAYEKVIRALQ